MKTLWRFISPYIAAIGSVVTIVTFLSIMLTDEKTRIIALCAFCLFLIGLLLALLYSLRNYFKTRYPKEYIRKASLIKYETTDGTNITYEVFRFIQSKRIILTEIKHGFNWSGTHQPEISSEFQSHTNTIKGKDKDAFDHAILKLRHPLLFNDTAVVHFKAICNDCDRISQPMVEIKVDSPCEMVHQRVLLQYKTNSYSKPAKLYRKKIDAETSSGYEHLKDISFNQKSKCYEHYMPWPEVGYFYKLEWER